jgi:8-oxo-dGTP pyrophosphatase MutT (NUDIX family)
MAKIIIASGPVIVEEGKVLLDQHGDTPFWKFPGGRVDNYEETLIETAQQRVKEEMGIEIEILDPVPFLMYTPKETSEGNIDVLLVHYLAKRIGEIVPGDDIRRWEWIDVQNLPNNLGLNITPTLRHFGFLK